MFPNAAWKWGAFNTTYFNGYVGNEESETIKALTKKRKLRFIRLLGTVLMLLGLVLYMIFD